MDIKDIYETHVELTRPAKVAKTYVEGRNIPPFATPKMQQHYGWLLATAKTNLCGSVIDVFANRTRLSNNVDIDTQAIHRDVYAYGRAVALTADGEVHIHPGYQFTKQDVEGETVITRSWSDEQWRYLAVFYGQSVVTFRQDKATGGAWLKWEEARCDEPILFERDGSVLEDVYPVQDELDYLTAATLIGVDRVAMPLWYILSAQASALQANRSVDLDPIKESILAITGDSAGSFPEPDTGKLLMLQQHAMQKVYAVTGVPSYMLSNTGDIPSGAALQIMSERMVQAVHDTQTAITPAWAELFTRLRVGEPVQWESAELITSDDRMARARTFRELGLPADVWLRELGLDPEDVMPDGQTLRDTVTASPESNSAITRAFFAGE